MATPSILRIPREIKDGIVKHLPHQDLLTLCLVHSSWIESCQARIFRTLDTNRRSNARLASLVALSPRIGYHIRRLRLSYPTSGRLNMSGYELQEWLRERDRLLAELVDNTTNLKVASVVLFCDGPSVSTNYRASDVGNLRLDCLATSLGKHGTNLSAFKLDFAFPLNGYRPKRHLEKRLSTPFIFLNAYLAAKSPVTSLTNLCLANLALQPIGSPPADPASATPFYDRTSFETVVTPESIYLALRAFVSSFPSLEYILVDNIAMPLPFLSNMLPSRLRGLELFDDTHSYKMQAIASLPTVALPHLRHLRLLAHPSGYESATGGSMTLSGSPFISLPQLQSLSLEAIGKRAEGHQVFSRNVAKVWLDKLEAPLLTHLSLISSPTSFEETHVRTMDGQAMSIFSYLTKYPSWRQKLPALEVLEVLPYPEEFIIYGKDPRVGWNVPGVQLRVYQGKAEWQWAKAFERLK